VESRGTTIVTRLVGGHMFAYPITLAWILGAVPLAIVWSDQALFALDDEQAKVSLVLHRLLWPAVGAFLAGHVPSIPWAVATGETEPRRRRAFWVGSFGLLALGGAFAAVVWGWFLVRTA
jgi:hypothetical protein